VGLIGLLRAVDDRANDRIWSSYCVVSVAEVRQSQEDDDFDEFNFLCVMNIL